MIFFCPKNSRLEITGNGLPQAAITKPDRSHSPTKQFYGNTKYRDHRDEPFVVLYADRMYASPPPRTDPMTEPTTVPHGEWQHHASPQRPHRHLNPLHHLHDHPYVLHHWHRFGLSKAHTAPAALKPKAVPAANAGRLPTLAIFFTVSCPTRLDISFAAK